MVHLQLTCTLNSFEIFPYSFLAMQLYSPLSVTSTFKIITLLLWECGQDEQESGVDQLYTGSGDADTVQFSITSSLTFTINV